MAAKRSEQIYSIEISPLLNSIFLQWGPTGGEKQERQKKLVEGGNSVLFRRLPSQTWLGKRGILCVFSIFFFFCIGKEMIEVLSMFVSFTSYELHFQIQTFISSIFQTGKFWYFIFG